LVVEKDPFKDRHYRKKMQPFVPCLDVLTILLFTLWNKFVTIHLIPERGAITHLLWALNYAKLSNCSRFTLRIVERNGKVSVLSRRGSSIVRRSIEMPWKIIKDVDGNDRKLHDLRNDRLDNLLGQRRMIIPGPVFHGAVRDRHVSNSTDLSAEKNFE
jgi:hypothetical protein